MPPLISGSNQEMALQNWSDQFHHCNFYWLQEVTFILQKPYTIKNLHGAERFHVRNFELKTNKLAISYA